MTALAGVTFQVDAGEIVGVLGPNGAGKSTLFRILSTWLAPDAGRARVLGFDTVDQALEVRQRIGYLVEHNALYESMLVEDYLEFIGRMRGLLGSRLRDRVDHVAGVCALEPVLRRRIQDCSKGNRQRVGVAAAIVHDPPVLILDEPTHGLDPIQVKAFLDFVRSLRAGRAVLFSNHVLTELSAISDRLLVLLDGRLVADETLPDLRARAASAGVGLNDLLVRLVREAAETPATGGAAGAEVAEAAVAAAAEKPATERAGDTRAR
ncbi:MAG TPA: ABC transporter ATP-binding protein [Thermoanaerobaculia bacterium]|nr:ABC transporter ATP-binding protein [Thermoanaerobaculia bacterium]